jgi:RNA polymerase sigma factor (sigma-70 family)
MADHLSDATLLDRFVIGREEAAFAALVRRHGAVVRACCRRILQSEHDAEDVVQATFLVLALRASEITWRDSVGGWLCGVARRLSLHARAGASRRYRRERPVASLAGRGWRASGGPLPEEFHPLADPLSEVDRRDLRRLLDDELSLLPTKLREPVVLCDLEGMTHAEAARRLGLPTGSMSRRLGRARALLRQRLAGRGLPVAVVVLLGVLMGVWAWERGARTGGGMVAVREAMAPFRQCAGDGLDLDRLVARIRSSDQPGELRDEISRVASLSAHAGEQLESQDPGKNRPEWRSYAAEMKRSALLLAEAMRQDDPSTLLPAARRLNASCVQCHLAFRQ